MADTDTERLLRDYHPVDVTVGPDVTAVGARAFVTTDARLLVFVADDQRNVVQLPTVELDPASLPRGDRGTLRGAALDLTAIDGRQVWLNQGRGCGCSSPLKIMERPVDW